MPVRLTKNVKKNHVNLLLLFESHEDEDDNGDDDDEPLYTMDIKGFLDEHTCTHYVWIKNLSALIQGEVGKNTHKKYICNQCLHYFYSDQKLQEHIPQCYEGVILPDAEHRWRWTCFRN